MSGPPQFPSSTNPQSESDNAKSISRRTILASLGTGAVAVTAGCSSLVPGTGSESLSTEVIADTDRRIAWGYPVESDDQPRLGYVALERRREFSDVSSVQKFQLNASVDLDNEYEFTRYQARIRTPVDYQREYGLAEFFVNTPGSWEEFHVYYDGGVPHRELVIEHQTVATEGTILSPFILNSAVDPLPSEIHIEFMVELTKPGLFAQAVTASDGGTLAFGSQR